MEVSLTADDADNAVQELSKQTSFRFFYPRYLRDLRLLRCGLSVTNRMIVVFSI